MMDFLTEIPVAFTFHGQYGIRSEPNGSIHARSEVNTKEWETGIRYLWQQQLSRTDDAKDCLIEITG